MNLNEQTDRIKQMMGLNESASQITTTLSLGVENSQVGIVQTILGILPNDNKYGKQTRNCVKEFQIQNHIKPTGSVGSFTKKYLEKLENKSGEVKWIKPEFCVKKDVNKSVTKLDDKPKPTTSDKKESVDLIFMGGLESVIPYNLQTSQIKNSTNVKNIKNYHYYQPTEVIDAINKNPNAYVVLYSAACKHSDKISSAMKNKNKLFIVEPYATSNSTKSSVKTAVSSGVPNRNVITGPNSDRGAGVVTDSTSTPKGKGHFDALSFVGKFIN